MSVGEVDLLVGISTHNTANPVRKAVQAIEQSYQQHFIRQRVVIVLMDGGEEKDGDGAAEAAPVVAGKGTLGCPGSLRCARSTA